MVQEVFRALGLVQRRRNAQVDQVGEILARRYGIPFVPKWRHVLGSEYTHALQILSQAEFVYDAGRSFWLQYQDSFNDILTRSFIDFLSRWSLAGAAATINRHGAPLDFGVLLDANQAFAQAHSQAAPGLRRVHNRRNRLPASHPYDRKTGLPSQFLTRREQSALCTALARAYHDMLVVIVKRHPVLRSWETSSFTHRVG
ncbi:MAG: hypothetical protein D6773_04810 [Alphaproteobacteria bacterium]|nr:MAG: hypothetical protein D6773_04810 [Alphaproteobacteria bacterium]